MTNMHMQRDNTGLNTFGLPFTDIKYNTVLAIGVAQSLTIPSGNDYYEVIFAIEPGANVWIANNATAVAPGATMAATNSELNPVARIVKKGDVLSFIAENANASIGIQLYAIQ